MESTIAPPLAMLRESAGVVHDELLALLRDSVSARFSPDPEGSPERIAGYLEDGLSLLTSRGFRLDSEVGLSMESFEVCRRLADQDARFRFIYRLPSSVGWGAAIGAAIGRALYGETHDGVRVVTATLNAFMTFLDGLLDEAPDVFNPHRESLLQLVRDTELHNGTRNGSVPRDHPYNTMCFLIARLWIDHFNRLSPPSQPGGLRNEFLCAALRSMAVEYSACDSRFGGAPPSMDVLYGRTSWPLWTQALAVMCQHGRPADVDLGAFRKLIFRIGEYAAYLDDVRDYITDCAAAQWNTVSLAYYSRYPFPIDGAGVTQRQLLANLADDAFAEAVIQTGSELCDSIEECLVGLRGVDSDSLRPLLADLTYEYLC